MSNADGVSQRAKPSKRGEVAVTSILGNGERIVAVDENATIDDQTLGALGYKQEFKRDFTILESFSTSFSILGLLPSIASTIGFSLGYSGTGGAVWGWLIAALCIQSTAWSMAELCSSMPTAGGLYYASAVLAPEGYGPLASWITGWSNILGFTTAPCSLNYALASMLVTCGEIAYPEYVAKTWHVYLTLLALLVLQGLISMQSTKFVGWVNKIGTLANVIVIFVFIIWFPVGSINTPKTNKSSQVWTTFANGTEWPIGWSTIMGFLTTIYTMSGYDAPFHLSEECSNANIAGPRAIIMTAVMGLIGGWAIVMVIVYTVVDIPSVLTSTLNQPFGTLCLQVLGPRAGLAMFALNIIAQFFCGLACVITTTRIIFAFARDGALPGSRYWSRVSPLTKTPVWATWGQLAFAAIISLLMFASPVAINAVFSIGAIGQYTAFTIPVAIKLFFDGNNRRFRPGPFSLGRASKPVGAIAVAWWCLIVPALCFPAVRGSDLTLLTMNWTCLIYGGTMFLAMTWYVVDARKWFKGPRINISHTNMDLVMGQDGSDYSGERLAETFPETKVKHTS